MIITAPYNFVPLSDMVIFPDWADKISHDIPFSDGISGIIECELIARSRIYIRNGGSWKHEDILDKADAWEFFNIDKRYIIPATSIKGMLRNVIEIASFGKMSRVDDKKYSVRDLSGNRALYVNRMSDITTRGFKARARSGWLTKDDNRQWHLSPCSYAKIEQDELAKYFERTKSKPLELSQCKTAKDKYEAWGDSLDVKFNCPDNEVPQKHKRFNKRKKTTDIIYLIYRKVIEPLGNGSKQGTIVFTGQVDRKHMEFIFFGESNDSYSIDPELEEEFIFIHSENGKPNKEWAYWRDILDRGGRVPIFYLTDPEGNPTSMGFAQMYRLPYENSIHNAISHTSTKHFEKKPDLAEAMFGFIGKDDTLKGRIFISHADVVHAEEDDLVTTVLGSPKPTYYPSYIEQSVDRAGLVHGDYKTLMDEDCRIRGWKRYPARLNENPPTSGTEKSLTKFKPLKKGAKFKFKIRVHNLCPVEFGALVWALTWGGREDLCHSLGMGKPLGMGLVGLSITKTSLSSVDSESRSEEPIKSIQDFENFMNESLKQEGHRSDWEHSSQITHLLAMADPKREPDGSSQSEKLRNMTLDPKNEYTMAKRAKLRLDPHIKEP